MYNQQSILSVVLLLLLTFVGCSSSELSEKEQYEEIRSSYQYKAYKPVSEKVVPLLAEGYNRTADSAYFKVKEPYLRLMLGYYWAIGDHPAFAFSEADLLTENPGNDHMLYLASMLNSCTMYQQGWTDLAKEESDKGMALAATNGDAKSVETETIVFHLLMGTVCIQQKNYDAARFHFAGFGQLTGIQYPYKIVDLLCDLKKGNVAAGMKKAKALSGDASVPENIREGLKEGIAEVESKGGDADSALFWPKFIFSHILDEMKASSRKNVRGLMSLVDAAMSKLG